MDFCWQGLRSVEVEVRNGQDSTRGPEIGSVDRAVTELFDFFMVVFPSFFFQLMIFMMYQDLRQFFFSATFKYISAISTSKHTYQDKIEEMEKRLAQAGKDKSEVVP